MPFSFGAIAVAIVLLYALSSIKILAEYERGVIFNLGRLQRNPQRSRTGAGIRSHSAHCSHFPAPGSDGSSPAGHHHSRQRYA